MKRSEWLVLAVLAYLLVGCASSGAETGSASARQRNLITLEDIQRAPPGQNTYEFIRGLRPNWLQTRGVQSLGNPVPARAGEMEPTRSMGSVVVYLDGNRAGSPEILRQIPVTDLQGVQYLGGTEATSRFGTDHSGGAILVTTRRG